MPAILGMEESSSAAGGRMFTPVRGGYVVGNNGQPRGGAYRLVILNYAALSAFVVVRRDGQKSVGAQLFGNARALYGVRRAI